LGDTGSPLCVGVGRIELPIPLLSARVQFPTVGAQRVHLCEPDLIARPCFRLLFRAVNSLADLDEEAFRTVVEEELARRAPEAVVRALKENPDVAARWRMHLLALRREVEQQLAARKAEYRATVSSMRADSRSEREIARVTAEYQEWRAKTIRLKGYIDVRIFDAISASKRQ